MQVTSYKLQVKRSNVQQRSKGTHAEEIRVKGQNTKAKSRESKVKGKSTNLMNSSLLSRTSCGVTFIVNTTLCLSVRTNI